jgi:hypothetical protein
MYQKNHVGSLKETVVLRFTNGYQITLEAGVEMSMSLTMVEQSAQQPLALDGELPCLDCGGEVGHRINCPHGIAFSSVPHQ